MKVKNTYIVKVTENSHQTVYVTESGEWFVTSHIVGHLRKITEEEGHKLISK